MTPNEALLAYIRKHQCEDCGSMLVVEPTKTGPIFACPNCDLRWWTYWKR